ncbi:MAG TPA: HAD family phosphatase [Acidimicrobiales bacterium]|nr:HAD family phosphatase [Acidimicrobiales bacterium]
MAVTPTQRKPSAVLLDLGGVFLDWDPRYLYRKLFGDDVAGMEDFLANICTPAWHSEQDRGQSISEACAERRATFPEHAEMIDAWGERAEEMISGVIQGSVEVFAELKARGVPCYALSNMERENWERRIEIYDFLGWFDGYFISGLEGVIKPDPEYFERALERLGLRPDEVVFIDDRPDNTEAAGALGIPAVVFTSPEALRGELVARGLLPPEVTLA